MTKVLVVDDMAVFREPIAAALRHAGCDAATAADGLAAIETAHSFRPDVILLDLAMPRMDGLAFLRARQTDPLLQQARIILLSAVSDREHVVEAARLGVRDYLLKSQFSLKDLLDRVQPREGVAGSTEPAAAAPEPPPAAPAPATSAAAPEPPPTAAPAPATSAAAPAQAAAQSADADGQPQPHGAHPGDDPVSALKSLLPIIRRSQLQELIDGCGELQALSPTVADILKMTQGADCSLERVTRAIKRDHAIALKILKLANSAVYARGEPVESVQKAVTRIGLTEIRQTVMNLTVVDRFGAADAQADSLIDVAHFWEHSIATGLIASQLTRGLGGADEDVDSAFTLGLVHDVGRLVYAEIIPQEYQQVLDTARRLRLPLDQVESRMLLINHADAMDRILHAWRFPRNLTNAIAFHHLSMDNIRHMARSTLRETAILALANRLAHALLLGSSGNEVVQPIHAFTAALKVPDSIIEQIEHDVPDQTDDMKFALLSNVDRGSWSARREAVRDGLRTPVRPLFVGIAPKTDPFRMFCDRLAVHTEEAAPNLAVVHITDRRDVSRLADLLSKAELQAGARGLPVLTIAASDAMRLDDQTLRGRAAARLAPPVTFARLIGAINSLLTPRAEVIEAAA